MARADGPLPTAKRQLEHASALFVQRRFNECREVCESLLAAAAKTQQAQQAQHEGQAHPTDGTQGLDLPPADLNMLLLLLLRLAREQGRWEPEWERACLLAGGIEMLSEDVLLLGTLTQVKAKAFRAARDTVEVWLAGKSDDFFNEAALGMQPSRRNYERVVELYILALAGMGDHAAGTEFLRYNTILAANHRQLLMDHVHKLENEAQTAVHASQEAAKAVVLPAAQVNHTKQAEQKVPPQSQPQTGKTKAEAATSVSSSAATTATASTATAVAVSTRTSSSSNHTPASREAGSTASSTVRTLARRARAVVAGRGRLAAAIPAALLVALLLALWAGAQRAGFFKRDTIVGRILGVVVDRLKATARMGLNVNAV
ncbi:hypothetical protein BC831DRAFT_462032 [Entophlyctis helioformis]|nr:hypothetical protein BC831DRAFT_462032 [Entophlyctis helioformis]